MRSKTRVVQIVVGSLKWQWVDHIDKKINGNWTKEVLEWYPGECIRVEGRLKGK